MIKLFAVFSILISTAALSADEKQGRIECHDTPSGNRACVDTVTGRTSLVEKEKPVAQGTVDGGVTCNNGECKDDNGNVVPIFNYSGTFPNGMGGGMTGGSVSGGSQFINPYQGVLSGGYGGGIGDPSQAYIGGGYVPGCQLKPLMGGVFNIMICDQMSQLGYNPNFQMAAPLNLAGITSNPGFTDGEIIGDFNELAGCKKNGDEIICPDGTYKKTAGVNNDQTIKDIKEKVDMMKIKEQKAKKE